MHSTVDVKCMSSENSKFYVSSQRSGVNLFIFLRYGRMLSILALRSFMVSRVSNFPGSMLYVSFLYSNYSGLSQRCIFSYVIHLI